LPKKPKFAKKPNFGFLEKFGLFGQFWFFWGFFLVFFLAFLENFGFHVAYIGGTYRVQKSDLDDSEKGTKKAM
jgi:hypothetical protein